MRENIFYNQFHFIIFKVRSKAFTIFEMLVTLVLSGIIVSASLLLYLNYENLVRGKNKQMSGGKETLQFYHIFKTEFENAVMIKSEGSSITFISAENSHVTYEFEQNLILRDRVISVDTFLIKVNDFVVLKDEITGFNNVITMELLNSGQIIPITLVKQYSNEIMMNINSQF